MSEDRVFRCRRTIDGKDHCPFTGTRVELAEHATETDHRVCVVCRLSLADYEVQTCGDCVTRARADLDAILNAYATLAPVVEATGYRNQTMPGGDALVMYADGSMTGGGPADDPMFKDPTPVIAFLESWERDWRREFDHPPAVALATVAGCVGYLTAWLPLAAKTHSAFEEYTGEVRALCWRVTHVTGLANDPMRAPARCFDCDGRLIRTYRPVLTVVTNPRRGVDVEGLDDSWECQSCQGVYTSAEYYLAVRAALEAKALTG